jgi:predicted RNA-binding Zn ribbon-like protein
MQREQRARDRKREDHVEQKAPFVFLGENLALDLANTIVPVRGGKTRDVLLTPHDVASWWSQAQAHYQEAIPVGTLPSCNQETLEALKRLRTALRHLFAVIARQHPLKETDLEGFNGLLQGAYPMVKLTGEGKPQPDYQIRKEEQPILLVVALAAFHLLTQYDLTRLRACQNEACPLFFYDSTKSATKHWCSVSCKERARSVIRQRRGRVMGTVPKDK